MPDDDNDIVFAAAAPPAKPAAKPLIWREIVYPLKYPLPALEAGGAPVTAITMREPDVEVLERIEEIGLVADKAPTIKQTREIISALSGIPPALA